MKKSKPKKVEAKKHTAPTLKEIEKEINYWTSVEDNKYIFAKKNTVKSFIRKLLQKEREKVIEDFVHTTTDLFDEGQATDLALIVANKLKIKLNK